MRRQDQISMQADVITQMTIRRHFARRNLAEWLPIVRIAKKYYGIDEVGLSSRQHVDSVVCHLCTLAVSADDQLCGGALVHSLSDILSHCLTTRGTTACFETCDIGWVVVNALHSDLSCAKHAVQCSHERWANDASYVTCLCGAARED